MKKSTNKIFFTINRVSLPIFMPLYAMHATVAGTVSTVFISAGADAQYFFSHLRIRNKQDITDYKNSGLLRSSQ
jgi:hypothetical protein